MNNDPTVVRVLDELGQLIPDRRPPAEELLRAGRLARRRRNQRNAALVVGVLIPAVAAGTALGFSSSGSDSGPDELAGSPTEQPGEGPVISMSKPDNSFPAAEVVGEVSLRDGCLLIGDSVAFWPYGTTWSEDDQAVVFSDAFDVDPVSVGSVFDGGGGFYKADQAVMLLGDAIGMAVSDCITRTGADGAVFAVPNG